MMDDPGPRGYPPGSFPWPACTGHGAPQRENVIRHLPGRKPVTGRCAVCGAIATRMLSNAKVCHTHYRQGAIIHSHGITNPIGMMRELAGKQERVQAEPAALPLAEAVPVAPSPPILSLTKRLKARRAAGI